MSFMKKLLSKLFKLYYGSSIRAKPFNSTKHRLFYEQSQHLTFALKSTIEYEIILQRKARSYITPGATVFDIGANIGQYALLFSDLVGPTGKVVSLEPDSNNFAFLQFNININKLKNVQCIKKGVSNTVETLEFYCDSETGGRKGSFRQAYVEDNFKGVKEEVETTTLDALITQFGIPSFIKIDVEGFEEVVIEGLTKSLLQTTFMIEVRGETKTNVFHYFNTRGYRCFYMDDNEDKLVSNPVDIPDFANLLFRKA